MSKADQLKEVNVLRSIWGVLGVISVGTVFFEFVRMVFQWARYGESAKIYLTDVLSKPRVSWVGVQNVIDWVWSAQLAGIAMFIAFLSTWLWSIYDDDATELKRQIPTKVGPE